MTDTEKLSFILEKEMEITESITKGNHRATDKDKFVKDRKKIRKKRLENLY